MSLTDIQLQDEAVLVPEWLSDIEIGTLMGNTGRELDDVLPLQIEAFLARYGQTVHRVYHNGKPLLAAPAFHRFLRENMGMYAAYKWVLSDKRFGEGRAVFVADRDLVFMNYGYNGCTVNFYGASEERAQQFRDFVVQNIVLEKEKGAVHVVVNTSSGLTVKQVGVAGVDFEEQNYAPEVLADFKHVIEDLKSADPCGRLVILNGPPGTGKTYLVRSLLKQVSNATFILIPPHMVSEISGPDLITCLTSLRDKNSKDPIILVIEDGERVLLPRGLDNDMSVTSMLNTCDGIFGTILDIRVLVTTNEKHESVDPALRRSGRMCRSIHVGPLDPLQCQSIFHRLTGEWNGVFTKPTNLSDIYRLARDRGWKPDNRDGASKMGFQAPIQLRHPRPEVPNPGDIEVEIQTQPDGVFAHFQRNPDGSLTRL